MATQSGRDLKQKYAYAVIEFEQDNCIYASACPREWINGSSCIWPPNKGNVRKAISCGMKPESDWLQIENITVLGNYSTYKEALYNEKKKCQSNTEDSDFDSQRNKRKVKKNRKYRDDSISPPPTTYFHESDEILSSSSNNDERREQINEPAPGKTIELNRFDLTSNERREQINEAAQGKTNDLNKFDLTFNESANINKENRIQSQELVDDYTTSVESREEDTRNDKTLNYNIENAEIIIEQKTNDDLWRLLQEMKQQLFIISERLDNIEKIMAHPRSFTKENNTKLPKLPLQNISELQDLEGDLENEELQECLLNYLQFIGGNDCRMCIFRVCEKMFTNYLAQFCSWTGKGGNFQLSCLKVTDILKRAVKVSYPMMTEHQFELAMMAWFSQGKTRFTREQARKGLTD